MDTNEFPSNSKTAKDVPIAGERPAQSNAANEKKITVVASNPVIQKKKPWYRKLKENMFGGEGQSVGEYVMFEVLAPAFRNMVADAAITSVERTIFGESRGGRGARGGPVHTSYQNMYAGPIRDPRDLLPNHQQGMADRSRSSKEIPDIYFGTRVEGVNALDQMYEIMSRFGAVTVSDLFAMANITPNYVDSNFGWRDLSGSDVRFHQGAYLLVLPRPVHLG